MHEMGHNFYTDHEDGNYALDPEGTDEVFNVSPMATIYVYTEDGHNDSCWENAKGESHAPDGFCGGLDNKDALVAKFCDHDTCGDPCRHNTIGLTSCTMNAIENHTPR